MAAKKTRKFKTEVQQLLDLVIHSLYSKKEIFLRELISNASDAIDRVQFEALTDKSINADEAKIELIPDKEAGTLTIRDSGIGMTVEELEANIGTIANSGTRKYLEQLQAAGDQAAPELIGQFGVGFYASFMVADKVTVLTRRAGSDDAATRWTSDGGGSYQLEEAEKDTVGTDITLHLGEGMEEYLEEYRLRSIVKEYSDYISYPVVMEVTRTKPAEEEGQEPVEETVEETLNSMKAIWKKAKTEVTEEEYKEFYHHISHDYGDPLETIHYHAEGATEFRALLYLPGKAPMDLFMPKESKGLHLYVKNVYITDDCKELMPEYLRFVKGVVDSSDLPLNVSREMLQDDAVIRRIRKSLVSKVLSTLSTMKTKRPDDYLKFNEPFGPVLKEGLHSDHENREKLQELLLFKTTVTEEGKPVSLRDYVDRMPSAQKDIYYMLGEDEGAVRNSPHLEAFLKKGYEVILMTDIIDEWVVQALTEYDGRKLVAVDRGEVDLADEEEKKVEEKKREEASGKYADLLKAMQEQLDEDIQDVRVSTRLTDSAACLVNDEHALNPNMERIMRQMNADMPSAKRILEVNADHPVLERMRGLYEDDKDSDTLKDYVSLLHDQAVLAEGGTLKNPSEFARKVSKLMV